MGLGPPPLFWDVLQVLTFPQGMEQVLESQIMVSHDGNWTESLSTWFPAFVECAMGLHTARCQPVGCFGNVICWCYLRKRNVFNKTFGVSCLLADMHELLVLLCCRVASNVMEQLCLSLVGEGSYPPAIGPTLGARCGLSWVYHLSWKGWLVHWANGSG